MRIARPRCRSRSVPHRSRRARTARSRSVGLVAAALLAGAAPAGAITIDFEALAPGPLGGEEIVASPYLEEGFRVSAPEFVTYHPGNAKYAGSQALAATGAEDDITLERLDGAAFDLLSISLSELFARSNQDVSVTFEGLRADTTTVQQTVDLDGSFGFESFSLTGFTDVVSVTWQQVADFHQFDEILATPEPGTALLVGLGAGALAAFRRRV